MERSSKVFIQPRHIYAPSGGDGHIHLSAPLVTVMARLHAAGVADITFRDENFASDLTKGRIDANVVGINLVGAPYIPKVIDIIRNRVRDGAVVLLGGQIVSSLDNHDIKSEENDDMSDDLISLFSKLRPDVKVLNGNRKRNLKRIFQLDDLPNQEMVSSIPVWEKIDTSKMKAYLCHEISFYLSQGCKYKCTFCQAVKNVPEKYRSIGTAVQDIEWLTLKAIECGIDHLDIYLSNLDLFQTPSDLIDFFTAIVALKDKYGFNYNFRGLATVDSILNDVVDENFLNLLKTAGLKSVGFGVDGATSEVFTKTGKVQNLSLEGDDDLQKCLDAIRKTAENGFVPEILMVFGHDLGDLEKSKKDLEAALNFSRGMVEQYGAVPRPHVVKNLVPGAVEWKKRIKNASEIELLLRHPEYFQALDYTALPSEITHADPAFRALVEKYYRDVCALSPVNSTKIIYPNTPEFQRRAALMGTTVEKLNEGQFDR